MMNPQWLKLSCQLICKVPKMFGATAVRLKYPYTVREQCYRLLSVTGHNCNTDGEVEPECHKNFIPLLNISRILMKI